MIFLVLDAFSIYCNNNNKTFFKINKNNFFLKKRVSGKKLFKGKDYNEVIKLNRDCLINYEYCSKIT